MSTTTICDEVSRVEDFIRVDFESYRREAILNSQEVDSEYEGYRVNPNYVARRIVLHKGITLEELRREDVIAAIHVAAENEWIYKDRERRG